MNCDSVNSVFYIKSVHGDFLALTVDSWVCNFHSVVDESYAESGPGPKGYGGKLRVSQASCCP